MMSHSRLARVRDICPLTPHHQWMYAARWMAHVTASVLPIDYFETGYTITVVANPWITWRRTFTTNGVAPTRTASHSRITVNEWCPSVWPSATANWHRLGIRHREAIVFLDEVDCTNFARSWSSQARRHLVAFKKISGVALRIGTLEDIEKNIVHSQVPDRLHEVFLNSVRKHLAVQPETIDILIAESVDDGVLGCFVAGNMEEIQQSYYITGFFKRGTEKKHAMVGLIEWWFRRTIERDYTTLNFGHITGPRPIPGLEPGAGYSIFKTHFGVRRVWWPGSFWKIRI